MPAAADSVGTVDSSDGRRHGIALTTVEPARGVENKNDQTRSVGFRSCTGLSRMGCAEPARQLIARIGQRTRTAGTQADPVALLRTDSCFACTCSFATTKQNRVAHQAVSADRRGPISRPSPTPRPRRSGLRTQGMVDRAGAARLPRYGTDLPRHHLGHFSVRSRLGRTPVPSSGSRSRLDGRTPAAFCTAQCGTWLGPQSRTPARRTQSMYFWARSSMPSTQMLR